MGARSRRGGALLGLLTVLMVAFPTAADSETSAAVTAENIGGLYEVQEHRWAPATATVSTTAGVTFSNPTGVPHGIHWIAPPSTPACDSGVPVGATETASGTNWKGTCTFAKPGTYTYYCTVHGAAMKGTITVREPGVVAATTGGPTKTQTTASLDGTVKPEGNPTSYYFEYGLTSSMDQKTPVAPQSVGPADFGEHTVSASLTGLTPSTPYHVELVAVYGVSKTEEALGGEQVFTTLAPAPPTVTTVSATAVGERSATMRGQVEPNGGKATEYFFEYGASTEYGNRTASVGGLAADNSVHAVSASISEASEQLQPGQTYHYRLVASNEAGGPVNGNDLTFTTAAAPPPSKEPTPSPAPEPTPTPGPTSPEPSVPLLTQPAPEAPLFGPALIARSLKLSGHASSVRGSVGVGQAGAAGRVEVDLLASPTALGVRGSKPVLVGRFVRSSASAGTLSFSVALSARARSALRRHQRLALSVRVTLVPRRGATVRLTHALTLRA